MKPILRLLLAAVSAAFAASQAVADGPRLDPGQVDPRYVNPVQTPVPFSLYGPVPKPAPAAAKPVDNHGSKLGAAEASPVPSMAAGGHRLDPGLVDPRKVHPVQTPVSFEQTGPVPRSNSLGDVGELGGALGRFNQAAEKRRYDAEETRMRVAEEVGLDHGASWDQITKTRLLLPDSATPEQVERAQEEQKFLDARIPGFDKKVDNLMNEKYGHGMGGFLKAKDEVRLDWLKEKFGLEKDATWSDAREVKCAACQKKDLDPADASINRVLPEEKKKSRGNDANDQEQ